MMSRRALMVAPRQSTSQGPRAQPHRCLQDAASSSTRHLQATCSCQSGQLRSRQARAVLSAVQFTEVYCSSCWRLYVDQAKHSNRALCHL